MSFKIGDVVWIYTHRSHDPKCKLCAIIAKGLTQESWLISFICSEAPLPPSMNKYYLPITKDELPSCLSHDSFPNCWDPVEFPTNEIENSIKKGKQRICGKIPGAYIEMIIDKVNTCPQIEQRKLNRYFA